MFWKERPCEEETSHTQLAVWLRKDEINQSSSDACKAHVLPVLWSKKMLIASQGCISQPKLFSPCSFDDADWFCSASIPSKRPFWLLHNVKRKASCRSYVSSERDGNGRQTWKVVFSCFFDWHVAQCQAWLYSHIFSGAPFTRGPVDLWHAWLPMSNSVWLTHVSDQSWKLREGVPRKPMPVSLFIVAQASESGLANRKPQVRWEEAIAIRLEAIAERGCSFVTCDLHSFRCFSTLSRKWTRTSHLLTVFCDVLYETLGATTWIPRTNLRYKPAMLEFPCSGIEQLNLRCCTCGWRLLQVGERRAWRLEIFHLTKRWFVYGHQFGTIFGYSGS